MGCLHAISDQYHVPPALIRSVRTVEGGRINQAVEDPNASYDLGPMQINSSWLPVLARYNITRTDVLGNRCTNLAVGAWILRREYGRFGNWFKAVAAYHAGPTRAATPIGINYARKVFHLWGQPPRQLLQQPVEITYEKATQ